MKKVVLSALASLLFTGSAVAQKNYEYNEYYYQKSTLFAQLPISTNDIVFLGDSQTDGCEWSEILGMDNVKNRGISSDVIQGLSDRLEPILKGKPQKLFILCGVNDISHDISADSIATAMRKLILKVKKGTPTTKIYLQSLLPIDNSFRRYKAMIGKEQVIVDANKLLVNVAREEGVTWIDLFSKMVDENTRAMKKGLTNDGLHLLGDGYQIWKETILPYIEE